MSDYLRLDEAPQWCLSYPTCSACCVDLDTDLDSWTCPSCGTEWDMDAGDGDIGELYSTQCGEERVVAALPVHDAWRVSHLRGEERDKAVERILTAEAKRNNS
jgi:hypothetical protein